MHGSPAVLPLHALPRPLVPVDVWLCCRAASCSAGRSWQRRGPPRQRGLETEPRTEPRVMNGSRTQRDAAELPSCGFGMGTCLQNERDSPCAAPGLGEGAPGCCCVQGGDGARPLGLPHHPKAKAWVGQHWGHGAAGTVTVPPGWHQPRGRAQAGTLHTNPPVMSAPGDTVWYPGPSSCTEIFMPSSL